MDLSYLLTPFIAWLVAGTLKFLVNSIRAKKLAFGLIGYGGLPSNHSAIVASMATLIGCREGISHPAFGVAVTLAFIVILDANSLRRHVGNHARAINRIAADDTAHTMLRERVGHTRVEIAAGILVGALVAFAICRL
ncbi:divergent PAP2 family protein [Noviherbaspirillum sp.]|uniref:divergent PAP2 family protein n=1 Tax=Noviherbaspirillum sp. TaxID=1926288 RepID=UPI002FE09C30